MSALKKGSRVKWVDHATYGLSPKTHEPGMNVVRLGYRGVIQENQSFDGFVWQQVRLDRYPDSPILLKSISLIGPLDEVCNGCGKNQPSVLNERSGAYHCDSCKDSFASNMEVQRIDDIQKPMKAKLNQKPSFSGDAIAESLKKMVANGVTDISDIHILLNQPLGSDSYKRMECSTRIPYLKELAEKRRVACQSRARGLYRDLGQCKICMLNEGKMALVGINAHYFNGIAGPLTVIGQCQFGHQLRVLMKDVDPRQFQVSV